MIVENQLALSEPFYFIKNKQIFINHIAYLKSEPVFNIFNYLRCNCLLLNQYDKSLEQVFQTHSQKRKPTKQSVYPQLCQQIMTQERVFSILLQMQNNYQRMLHSKNQPNYRYSAHNLVASGDYRQPALANPRNHQPNQIPNNSRNFVHDPSPKLQQYNHKKNCKVEDTYDRVFHKIRINLTQSERPEQSAPISPSSSIEIQPRVLAKSESLVYKSLLKSFEASLQAIQASKILTLDNISEVLLQMNFLTKPLSSSDQHMLSGIYNMLGGVTAQGVKQDNLFSFILIICNVEFQPSVKSARVSNPSNGLHRDEEFEVQIVPMEIGKFDEQGNWICILEEQEKVRRMFQKLAANRMTQRSASKKAKEQEYEFKPKICENSRQLAQLRRQKLAIEAEIGNIKCSNSLGNIADKLDLHEKVKKSKLQIKLQQKSMKQLQECTFKPNINRSKDSKDSSKVRSSSYTDRCNLLFDMSKKRQNFKIAKTRLSTTDEIEMEKLKECTFKPKQTKHKISTKPVVVRNRDKVIGRLAQGRVQRQTLNVIKDRGYPKDITNWTKFIRNTKTPKISSLTASANITNRNSPRHPLLTIDIKVCDNIQQDLEIYEGDSIQNLTCKVLVRNRLNYDYFSKLMTMICDVLGTCSKVVVKNGFVFSCE